MWFGIKEDSCNDIDMRQFPPKEYYIAMVTKKGSLFNIGVHVFLNFHISIGLWQLHYLEPKSFSKSCKISGSSGNLLTLRENSISPF